MAKVFTSKMAKFKITEDQTEAQTTVQALVDTWLDGLEIGSSNTVYAVNSFLYRGFLWVHIIYEQ